MTIEIDAVPRMYLDFRQACSPLQRKRDVTALGIADFTNDYFLAMQPGEIRDAQFSQRYSAVYSDAHLAPFCMTLLQNDVRARITLTVKSGARPSASFTVEADNDVSLFLKAHFRSPKTVNRRECERLRNWKAFAAPELRSFTLPRLPGIEEALPLPLDLRVPATDQTDPVIGEAISPITNRSIGSVSLPHHLLNRGLLVSGTTGSGKTNTVMKLAQEIEGPSVLIFDVKREYRSLFRTTNARVYGYSGHNLLTHNFLKPEGPASQWVKEFADIFSQVISRNIPASGSKDVIAETLDRLYRERGVYDGSEDYPHVGELLEALEERSQRGAPDRERNWLASAMRVLRTLGIGTTRQAFYVRRGLSLSRLLEGKVIVELDGIGDEAGKALLTSVILQKIRNKLATGPPNQGLRHLVVVEEAQNLLARGSESTTVLSTTCREIRSFGVGLVYVTQMPSGFSKNALANVNAIVSHRLVLPEDLRVMTALLGLPSTDLIAGLDVGHAILKADATYVVRIPEVERPFVKDDEIPETRTPREEVSTRPALRTHTAQKIADLDGREKAVFTAVCQADAVYPAQVRDTLGYSYDDVSKTLKKLVSRGLLWFRPVKRVGAKGRPPVIHFPSPAGHEAFRSLAGAYPDRGPGTGENHAGLVQQAAKALGIERQPHPRFDLLYEDQGRQVAVEVETGSNGDSQVDENLAKSVEFQDEARFAVTDRRGYNRILQAAARYAWTKRRPVTVRIALLDDLPEWSEHRCEPVSPTS